MEFQEIAQLIKKRRELLNLSQYDLAELSDVGIKTIHLIERSTGNPSFETMEKIAEVLGLEIIVQVKEVN